LVTVLAQSFQGGVVDASQVIKFYMQQVRKIENFQKKQTPFFSDSHL
jgi:hypothetical protein